jgi:dihydrofolate reductase
MNINAILACDENWGIGNNGELPWPKNSADLKWFKDTTLNSAVVMGRGTWYSGMPKPLPKRRNIVITNTPIDGVECYTLDQFKSTYSFMSQPIWIIGGAQLLESSLDIIEEIWLSRIKGTYKCDTFLPKDQILKKFEKYEHYFDGELTTEKYRRNKNETVS